jgi:hypothetical protein
MKRMSKAEEALNRQIKEIQHQVDEKNVMIERYTTERSMLISIKNQLMEAMQKSRQVREAASARNKP